MQFTRLQGADNLEIVRVTPDNFSLCYDLLEQAFPSTELDSRERMLGELTTHSDSLLPEQFIMLACSQAQRVISLIVGCYLALPNRDQGIGFIEYLVTYPDFRQQGHATALLESIEREMIDRAHQRGERLALILGEVEPEMVSFKERRGYQCLPGSSYVQPPIDFDPNTGSPLSPEIPLTLMIKPCESAITIDLILAAVAHIFRTRYGPTLAVPSAAQQAMDYIMQHIYEPFATSIQKHSTSPH